MRYFVGILYFYIASFVVLAENVKLI